MFESFRMRLRNMATIKTLCEGAERYALADGQRHPGAEHFLLAAIDLPDETAHLAFNAAGADANGFRSAIIAQYAEALEQIGCDLVGERQPEIMAVPPNSSTLFEAGASGQEVMRTLAKQRSQHRPLRAAHVVELVAAMKYGVAARALNCMNVDREVLRTAAARIAAPTEP